MLESILHNSKHESLLNSVHTLSPRIRHFLPNPIEDVNFEQPKLNFIREVNFNHQFADIALLSIQAQNLESFMLVDLPNKYFQLYEKRIFNSTMNVLEYTLKILQRFRVVTIHGTK